MSLPGTTLRRRRTNLRDLVTNLDAFTKTTQEVKEEKSTSGGIVSVICFIVVAILCIGELTDMFFGDPQYEYRFSVDTAYTEQPSIELDMIVATPCNSLSIQLPDSASEFHVLDGFKKDPTRFEFTDEELIYWNELRKAQGSAQLDASVFRGLEKMTFVSGRVEEGLGRAAEKKQKEEEDALEREKENEPEIDEPHGAAAIILIGNNMNMFQIISSNSGKDEGTACRIHGSIQVNKVKDDSILITVGKEVGIEAILNHISGMASKGNISHRIEKLHFGPRIPGLVTPLAGTEQISKSGSAEYRYFLKIVPTKIFHGLFGGHTTTFQYSVTSTKKLPKGDEHFHSGILIHYDFAATVIEVRAVYTSAFQLMIRLCSAVGGVFATSSIIHSLFQSCCCFWTSRKHSTKMYIAFRDVEKKALIYL
ncbi:unnamed protein product [Enterobius vermicularis]|uniref:Endoplasmic reticulum-Golgi intermediate compartment protein 2 n=1 Tax=Enterobius vermicularis TaxID=51028 RepID=A0A0N4VI13_ENTVE|nr:unnamed protein product [Enterobius vermicularis]